MHISGSIETELGLLKSKVNKLEYDFKTARLTIDEHCSKVKAKIDIHAEYKIKKINEECSDLISQVDTYQAELFKGLDKRLAKLKVESLIKETRDLIESQSGQIELIQQQLDKIRQEEKMLSEQLFKKRQAHVQQSDYSVRATHRNERVQIAKI
jgi:hypothetical protein